MSNASKTACLLIHGFGGTTFEVEPLVPALEALCCTVATPLLPGHGTSIEDFKRTFFPDWLDRAEQEFLALAETHDRVVLIGFSMGAALALLLAGKHGDRRQLLGLAALSPPWRVVSPYAMRRFVTSRLPGFTLRRRQAELGVAARPSLLIAPHKGYANTYLVPQIRSLALGIREMRQRLPQVRCPLLFMADLNDRLCPPEAALRIARLTDADDIRVRWVRMREKVSSHHMLTTHKETGACVAATVAGFVRELMLKAESPLVSLGHAAER